MADYFNDGVYLTTRNRKGRIRKWLLTASLITNVVLGLAYVNKQPEVITITEHSVYQPNNVEQRAIALDYLINPQGNPTTVPSKPIITPHSLSDSVGEERSELP